MNLRRQKVKFLTEGYIRVLFLIFEMVVLNFILANISNNKTGLIKSCANSVPCKCIVLDVISGDHH